MNSNSGQALLLTLLTIVVLVTIVTSIVSRSITDVRLGKEQEESQRVYVAAESGLEQSLRNFSIGGAENFNLSFDNVNVNVVSGPTGSVASGNSFIFDKWLASGEVLNIWLAGHLSDSTLDDANTFAKAFSPASITLCFGTNQVLSEAPALETSLIYKNSGGQIQMRKLSFDPDNSRANSFDKSVDSSPPANKCGILGYSKSIGILSDFGVDPASNKLYLLRVRPLYNESKIGIIPLGDSLPIQGFTSTASAVSRSNITSRQSVFLEYPSLPSVFDFTLYSGNSSLTN